MDATDTDRICEHINNLAEVVMQGTVGLAIVIIIATMCICLAINMAS
jgi:hypothetical protein